MVEKDYVCEPYFYANPMGLLYSFSLRPDSICVSTNINSFARGTLLLILIGIALAPVVGWVGIVFTLLIALMLYGRWLFEKQIYTEPSVKNLESFVDGAPIREENTIGAFPSVPITSPGVVVTGPTPANPFMNVLLDEIKYNPMRPPAADVTDPNLKTTLDNFFRVQWTSDPTDVFGKTQGQRQFYTMPSTSIPSDRESYQNWLYKVPGKTCKEGNRDACVPGTNGAAIPWLNQPN